MLQAVFWGTAMMEELHMSENRLGPVRKARGTKYCLTIAQMALVLTCPGLAVADTTVIRQPGQYEMNFVMRTGIEFLRTKRPIGHVGEITWDVRLQDELGDERPIIEIEPAGYSWQDGMTGGACSATGGGKPGY